MLASWLPSTIPIIEPRLACGNASSPVAVSKLGSLTEGKHSLAFEWRQVWNAF
jgi:hypothetical protein